MRVHYNKVDSYIENLKSHGLMQDKMQVGFFIEDTTVLGNVYAPPGWEPVRPVILCHCKQFLDEFEKCTKLDFCICASSYSNNSFLWFINKQSSSQYREIEIDLESIEILNFQPKVLGWKISIPTDGGASE